MRIGEIIREVEVLPIREPATVPITEPVSVPTPREPVPA